MAAAAALLAVGLAGCAAGSEETTDSGAEPAAGPVDGGDADSGGVPTEAAHGGDDGRDEGPEVLTVAAPLGRKVVFNARLSLEVADTAAAAEDVRRTVEAAGGFVASADLHRVGPGDALAGSLTLRVPADDLSTTLRTLKDMADAVIEESIDSDDVTGEYADVESQLRNLRALEVELLGLLSEIRERTDSAEQVLTVFQRVREVRSEIERLEGRRQVLDDLVALSTIHLDLQPTPSAAPIAADEWRPGGVVRDALRATVTALQTVADLAIWLALTVLPVLVVVVVLPLGVAYAVRRAWRRRTGPSPTP